MRRCFVIGLLLLTFVYGRGQEWALLHAEFDKLTAIKNSHYGFSLYDLDNNQFLFGINESKHFTPASNTKVFTLQQSLAHLGDSIPGLHYVERGDSLVFWGTGDPSFLHSKLDSRRVYNFLKDTDKQLFYAVDETRDETFYRIGWTIEDYEEAYQPELSSFPIYGNLVSFKEQDGNLISVPSFFQSTLHFKEDLASRFKVSRSYGGNYFYSNSIYVPRNYSVEKPFRYTDDLFVRLLSDTLKKEVSLITVKKPADFKTLHAIDTHTVLREMMLSSDNFMAEQLAMLISLNLYDGFKTAALREEMKSYYTASLTDKIALHDASGLSVYNKVTPQSMVELLLLIVSQVSDETELHSFFPAGGVNGTLKNSYALDQAETFIWAKTGSISSVYGQSGYLKTRSGRKLVFSFLSNSFFGSATPIRKEMVEMMTFIRKNY